MRNGILLSSCHHGPVVPVAGVFCPVQLPLSHIGLYMFLLCLWYSLQLACRVTLCDQSIGVTRDTLKFFEVLKDQQNDLAVGEYVFRKKNLPGNRDSTRRALRSESVN